MNWRSILKQLKRGSLAENGAKVISGTTAVTPATGYYFFAIQVITDITVSAQGDVTGFANPDLTQFTLGISAGTVIYGKWTSITLSAGQAIGYYAEE